MTETVRVYINARSIDVPPSATALEAVEAFDPGEASAIRAGERMITDSRGLPSPSDAPVHNGAIFRIVRARGTATEHADFNEP